jgi:hypothetical protein
MRSDPVVETRSRDSVDGRPVLVGLADTANEAAVTGAAFGPMVNALVAAALFAIMLLVLRRRRGRTVRGGEDPAGTVPVGRDDVR